MKQTMRFIDYAVSGGARIHFNLSEHDPALNGFTQPEMQYGDSPPNRGR
jgi:hypothetical protein